MLRERSPTPEPSVKRQGIWSLGSTQLHRLGDGKSRVAGEDTPHAPRAFADPRAFGQTWRAGSGARFDLLRAAAVRWAG
jgi:hypothetical protein